MRRPSPLPLSRSPLFLLSLFLLLTLAACAGQTATPTVDHGPWTVTPTVTPPPSTVTPTPTPEPTPTPTQEPITLENTFGLTGDALKAFRGAEKHITRAEDGSYLVTARVRNPETGELEEVQYILDPTSFNTHPEITNPLGLDTVQAKDADGNPVTLLWLPETREFRLAYDLQPVYDGVNTDTPTFNPEAYENAPTFTIDDIQSGFAIRNLLLALSQQMAEEEKIIAQENNTTDEIPFTRTLHINPDATRYAWKELGGNSLLFKQLPEGKYVKLKAKGNDKSAVEQRYDNLTMKALPFGAHIQINGDTYFGFFIANFDPVDFDPAHPEQGADPKDPQNWKFMLAIPQYGNQVYDGSAFPIDLANMFVQHTGILDPLLILYGDETYQKNHPLLAQLLQIKGNDASKLGSSGGKYINLQVNIDYNLKDLPDLKVIETQSLSKPLPPELQLMLFLFEVGVAQ